MFEASNSIDRQEFSSPGDNCVALSVCLYRSAIIMMTMTKTNWQ